MEMPQMNKGGKFIFGEFVIYKDGTIQFPPQTIEEYKIAGDTKIYNLPAARKQSAFTLQERDCFIRQSQVYISKDIPALFEYRSKCGEFIRAVHIIGLISQVTGK